MQTGRATMDFFGEQDAARKRTRRLVLLYGLAVVLMCGAVAAVTGIAFGASNGGEPMAVLVPSGIASILTGLIIAGGSAYRIAQFRGGGSSVALALGGKRIAPDSTDPYERRVLNVVEEMAIASGVPVPPVYMLHQETAINAFAAGYTTGDAVIGVTHGCVVGLTRDELQGVMAHEFSHILNGDMRLNIRMIGLINGIVLLSLMGHIVMRSALYAPRSRGKNDSTLPLLVIGVVLLLIGSLGSVMGRFIQAAVSRQREFLADAAAVQFTRNPDGIANALRRIGGATGRGRLKNAHAEEANHMLFGEGIRTSSLFESALASHPPLPKRIRAINPGWDGTMLEPIVDATRERIEREGTPAEKIDRQIRERLNAKNHPDLVQDLLPLLALAGNATPVHVEHARRVINAIPQKLKDAAHDVYGARAVVYCLLLDSRPEILEVQMDRLRSEGGSGIAKLVEDLRPIALPLDRHLRLPLLDMTLGTLAELSEQQHREFRENIGALVDADQQLDLFEWVSLKVLEQHLDERFEEQGRPVTHYYSLAKLGDPISVLLSTMAHAGAEQEEQAAEAFKLASSGLRIEGLRLMPREDCSIGKLESALDTLRTVAPRHKQELLKACAICAGSDRQITPDEAELLRAVSDILGVPTPLLLPGQRLT